MCQEQQERRASAFFFAEGCPASYVTYLFYKDTLYKTIIARYEPELSLYSRLTPEQLAICARAVAHLNVDDWDSAEQIPLTPDSGKEHRILEILYESGTTVKWMAESDHPSYKKAEALLMLLGMFPLKPVSQAILRPTYCLVGVYGDRYIIDRTPFLIGRRSAVFTRILGLALPGGAISRVHAAIITEDGQLFVRDEGSKNGTYCNGERLISGCLYPLPPESVLQIDHFVFRIAEIEHEDD